MKIGLLAFIFVGLAVAQIPVSGGVTLQTSANVFVTNSSTTGTTVNKLAKLTGAPATAVITATADTTGIIGIVVAGAGTTGSAQVARLGSASCVFDGATTSGDYVQNSPTVAGDCHDVGASCPVSGQLIGTVQSTNAAGGTYSILLGSTCPGGGGAQQFNNQGTATTYTVLSTDCGKIITFTAATAVTLTIPAGLGAGCVIGALQLGTANITPTASSTTINQRLSLTKTAGQYALIWLTAYAADTFTLTGDLQ